MSMIVPYDPQRALRAMLDEAVRANGGKFIPFGASRQEVAHAAMVNEIEHNEPCLDLGLPVIVRSRVTPKMVINAACVALNVSRDELLAKTRKQVMVARRKALFKVMIDRCWPQFSILYMARVFSIDNAALHHMKNTWRADRHGEMTLLIEAELDRMAGV